MPSCVTVTILGRPQAKGRPRFSGTGHAYTPTRTRDAEELMQGFMRQACSKPLEGPLSLEVSFCFRRPNSWSKAQREAVDEGYEEPWYTGRPDVENLLKLLLDAGNGILWVDDAQIVKADVCKVYSDENETVINVFPAKE